MWVLLWKEFDLEAKDRKGSDNLVVDNFLRLEGPWVEIAKVEEFEGLFPKERLLSINNESSTTSRKTIPLPGMS